MVVAKKIRAQIVQRKPSPGGGVALAALPCGAVGRSGFEALAWGSPVGCIRLSLNEGVIAAGTTRWMGARVERTEHPRPLQCDAPASRVKFRHRVGTDFRSMSQDGVWQDVGQTSRARTPFRARSGRLEG